jgi:septal ring factor EnvC (AmiA/AmiB activator)
MGTSDQQTSPNAEDTTFTNGITISTPDRTEAYAVYDGEVLFAGTMRGYGKMVIIDHDQEYYSVTARFNELHVKEGDLVKQGQVIGLTGKNATLFGKGLYFEIRHGEVAENPLDWFKPGTLATR